VREEDAEVATVTASDPGPDPSPSPPPPRPPEFLALLSVPPGGEAILIRELADLGVRARTRSPGVVQLRADRDTLARIAREARCGADLRAPEDAPALPELPAPDPPGPADGIPRVVAALALRALRSFSGGEVRVLPGSGRTLEEEAARSHAPAERRAGAAPVHLRAFPEDADATAVAAALATLLREDRRARHAILSRVADLEPRVGRTATRRWTFGEGDSAWRLLFLEPAAADADHPEPARAIRGRPPEGGAVVARSAPRGDPAADETRFPVVIAENAWLRRRWPEQQRLDCYRLYDRDLATIPWAVDRYADALHITIYPAEDEKEAAEHSARESRLLLAAGEALAADPASIFVKRKGKRARGVQHEVLGREKHTRIVVENGLRFLVNLSDYVDTGLFLDQRLARLRVREEAKGKRFLNLFSYTGSFTVAAAAGGAAATVSVDTSQVYLDWARENLRLNRLDGGPHRLVREDTMRFLREHPPGAAYDLAVVDPPTTSIRHGEPVWDLQRDHAELLALLRPLVTEGGVAIFSTNFRAFRLAAELPGWTIVETTPASIPADFRDRKVHRAFRLTAVEARSAV
jgi:23S rRNA G2069 N7-methylase RlmK/C1962 C5-methylase RlmI